MDHELEADKIMSNPLVVHHDTLFDWSLLVASGAASRSWSGGRGHAAWSRVLHFQIANPFADLWILWDRSFRVVKGAILLGTFRRTSSPMWRLGKNQCMSYGFSNCAQHTQPGNTMQINANKENMGLDDRGHSHLQNVSCVCTCFE